MTDPSDEALMRALCGGDEQAFNSLLDRHLDAIHRYLQRQLRNSADADELSQETFMRLWTQAKRFDPSKSRLTTWLHRIAHNLMVDRVRQRQAQGMEAGLEDLVAETPAGLITESRLQWLNQALGDLPANQRWALALVYLQGFSNDEAASIMGVGVRALESLLARGKQTLKGSVQ